MTLYESISEKLDFEFDLDALVSDQIELSGTSKNPFSDAYKVGLSLYGFNIGVQLSKVDIDVNQKMADNFYKHLDAKNLLNPSCQSYADLETATYDLVKTTKDYFVGLVKFI